MLRDAVTVAPDLYKVLLENDRVRAWEERLSLGPNRRCTRIQVISLSPSATANTGSAHPMAKVWK